MIRIVHYINQFFGQIGGEDKAHAPPSVLEGPVGPGMFLNQLLSGKGEVVATLICGDNYFFEEQEKAVTALLEMIAEYEPDAFVAGPAFHAGRYGLACGAICKRVKEDLGIPVVTGMYPENPGAELYKKDLYIIETTSNAAGMRKAMPLMVKLLMKMAQQEPIGSPSEEGYIPQGIKRNVLTNRLAAQRAVDVLLRKMKMETFQTEIPFPDMDLVPPADPIHELKEATIALVTEGGLYPKGNPDNMPRARSTRYAKYDISGLMALDADRFESIHRGFDTTFINMDPNRLLPLDVLHAMEKEGIIKGILPQYFVTTGVATTMENAKRIGKGIAKELKEAEASGVILTAT